MKKLICLLPLLFLTGCSRPAWETVCDTIPSVAALAQDSCAYSISLGMPQELQLAEQDGRTAIYSTAQGEMEVRTETFFASSSETAISYLTAMEPDALTVLRTERFDLPEYQFVWLSATEQGTRLNRADLVMDGMDCYAVVCSTLEQCGNTYDDAMRQVLSTFGLFVDEGI